MNQKKVLICMATYNGEKYLEQQLRSLAEQTYQNFLLLVHDDGSTDRTVDILRRWEREEEINMMLIEDGMSMRDSSKNFVHIDRKSVV